MGKNVNQSSDDNELPKPPSTPEVEDLLKRLARLVQELLKLLGLTDQEKPRQNLQQTTQPMDLQELQGWLGKRPLLSTNMYIDNSNEDRDK